MKIPVEQVQALRRTFAEYLPQHLQGQDIHTRLEASIQVRPGPWSYVSGPDNTPTFSDATLPTSDVTVDLYGTYVFRWTETNGSCAPRTYDVTIDFNEDPTGANAGADQALCGVLTTTLTGVAHMSRSRERPCRFHGVVEQVSGIGTATFVTPGSPSSVVNVSLYGSYVLR